MNLSESAKYGPYKFILGRNILQDVKLNIKNNTRTFVLGKLEIPLVLREH